MKLNGRRESTNVDDRRGRSGAKIAAGGGIIGVIVAAIMMLMNGASISEVQEKVSDGSLTSQTVGQTTNQSPDGEPKFSKEEQELATFSKQILASTEDIWTEVFKKMGRKYKAPTMVLYTGSVQTGCGNGSASMGPFYCSADQCLYIDLSFFSSMKKQLGASGDFAYAYVIAHEVGHHVEYLLGTLDQAHEKMARLNEKEANKVSVRLELLADFYAGVWGYHEKNTFASLEPGDMEEAINCAEVIGDNYLQEKARGYSMPESFTHGTSAQRMKWLKLGLTTGDMSKGNTFSLSDREL